MLLRPAASCSLGLFHKVALRGGIWPQLKEDSESQSVRKAFRKQGAVMLPKAQLIKSKGQLPSGEQLLCALPQESPPCLRLPRK